MYDIPGSVFEDKVREIVGNNPHKIYEGIGGDGCLYVHHDAEGAPSGGCLIGQALYECGVPFNVLYEHEGESAGRVIPAFVDADDRLVGWADAIQGMQDNGIPWGKCLHEVDMIMDM